MGIFSHVTRGLKNWLRNRFRKKKSSRDIKKRADYVPRQWVPQKPDLKPQKQSSIIVKHKRRVPWLRTFKRGLAVILLFINFVFSQFLLGSIGEGAQPMFLLFLANSFILLDYLWKTRRKPE